jgi:group I intron endonuclease
MNIMKGSVHHMSNTMISMKDSGIYLIIYTRPSTGKKYFYVGSTVKFSKRWSYHKSQLNSKEHGNYRIQNIFNKHGIDVLKFIPIEKLEHPDEDILEKILDERENFWMRKFMNRNHDILNINKESARTSLGVKRREETKQKLSIASKKYLTTEEGKETHRKLIELSTKHNSKVMPVMINTVTGHRIEKCKSIRELAKKIGCATSALSRYINGQANYIKYYVSEEHFYSKKLIVQLKEVPTPKFYNIKTLQIIEEQLMIKTAHELCKLSTPSITALINKKKSVVKNWTLYNPEVHLTETDYQYE